MRKFNPALIGLGKASLMNWKTWFVIGMFLSLCFTPLFAVATVEDPEAKPLWPDGVPDAQGEEDADHPAYFVYLPPEEGATGAAVVVCPGGGYGNLAMQHEGEAVAQWLNDHGIAAFVLKYRVSPYRHPVMLNDAKRMVRTVRARADEWGIDANRIGILGFSAGGHLASTVLTQFDEGNPDADDPVERVSARPDFGVLIYPVITFIEEKFVHKGSRRNLLGENPDPELIQAMSSEKRVTQDTPPTFLVHSYQDEAVPAENSILFYLAMREAGISGELHIYEKGAHGFGLAPNDPVLSSWADRCIDWFQVRGIMPGEDAEGEGGASEETASN